MKGQLGFSGVAATEMIRRPAYLPPEIAFVIPVWNARRWFWSSDALRAGPILSMVGTSAFVTAAVAAPFSRSASLYGESPAPRAKLAS
eukprot:6060031-Prymnesium_polylepis.1